MCGQGAGLKHVRVIGKFRPNDGLRYGVLPPCGASQISSFFSFFSVSISDLIMPPPPTTTVYFFTSKITESDNYEETFRTLVNTLVSVEATLVVMSSDGSYNLGILTKEKILETAQELFEEYGGNGSWL